MLSFIKQCFWKCILAFCYLSYPFIALYEHYFKPSMNIVRGKYCSNRIKSKGENLWIKGMGTFTDPQNIKIGNHCRIGENAYFHCYGGLILGNNVIISRNVTIYTANHNFHSTTYLPYDNTEIGESVKIDDNVWIGMNVSILPGVHIGKNSIIGLGSIITKDVPDNAIVVGHNKIIGFRPELSNYKLFGKEYPNA